MLILEAAPIASKVEPGQFIQIRCAEGWDPFLPRPMSVYRVEEDKLFILYEVVGKGTARMAQIEKGHPVEIYGPLGRPFFRVPEATHCFLVGGGVGLAPFYALAEAFLKNRSPISHPPRPKITVLFGARTRARVYCEDDFQRLGVPFEVATDDGTYGFRGRVTELLEQELVGLPPGETAALYACGPNVMMREVCRIAVSRNLPCQVSLDEPMACGFGICFGCAVKVRVEGRGNRVKDGATKSAEAFELEPNPKPSTLSPFTYKLACKDGPVFEAREVAWD